MFLALSTTVIAKLRLSKLLFVFGPAPEAPDIQWSKAMMDLPAPQWGHSDWESEDGTDSAPKCLCRYSPNPQNTFLRQRDSIIKEGEVTESDSNEDSVSTKTARGEENKSSGGNRTAHGREGSKPHSFKGTRAVIKSVQKTKHSSLETC